MKTLSVSMALLAIMVIPRALAGSDVPKASGVPIASSNAKAKGEVRPTGSNRHRQPVRELTDQSPVMISLGRGQTTFLPARSR